ncbi:MAG: NfeD family protein [Deltaproteobacteria bacterium]|nr:NfeD family protein [Deltaproteobacteria bacterium]
MPWWGWITVGALLLVAEITIVDLEFYLVFLGISALAVGMSLAAGIGMPYWLQWLVFAGLAIVSLVVFRQRVYSKLRPAAEGLIGEGIEGELATAIDAIPPGASGGVMLRGSRWTGRNQGPTMIQAGASCRVERRQGLVLDVRVAPSPSMSTSTGD